MIGLGGGSGGGRGEGRDHELLVESDLDNGSMDWLAHEQNVSLENTHDELDKRVVERLVVQKSRPLDELEHVVDEVLIEGVCLTDER